MDRLSCYIGITRLKEFLDNRSVKEFLDHALYLLIVAVLIPAFFCFELFHVLPSVVGVESSWFTVHVVCAIFLMSNIIGNMLYGMFTDTSIRRKFLQTENNQADWSSCAVCETVTPPRSWHCASCNICILKRDHHCQFFACCVGYFNYRYFVMFVLHVFVAMVYAFYFNVQFIAKTVSWNDGLVILKFILPLAHFAYDIKSENTYILMLIFNIIVGSFTGFLSVYHMINVIHGMTSGEKSSKDIENSKYNFGIRRNIIEVFGQRWYLTWISPFIPSSVPGNGISWDDKSR